MERFLQLSAEDNMRVVNATTASQYFHLLRRQAASLLADARPLVVMTPKSLLRHPLAAARAGDLVDGAFLPVLDDARTADHTDRVTRLVFCSGKVWADVAADPRREQSLESAVVRIEELYPFPVSELQVMLDSYPNARDVIWLQEEPRNMGAWTFVAPRLGEMLGDERVLRYVGRPDRASPAEGWARAHAATQQRLIHAVLETREAVSHAS